MNKLIIDNVEYELKNVTSIITTPHPPYPQVLINGNFYYGEAIPKEKPKDYEILSVRDRERHNCIVTVNWIEMNFFTVKNYLEDNLDVWEIYSIKRLSDGEVFTIGDRLLRMDDVDIIKSFKLNHRGNEIWICTDKELDYGVNLFSAEKAKQPILRTEDGKDIYEGDKTWYVSKDSFTYDQYDFIDMCSGEIPVFSASHTCFVPFFSKCSLINSGIGFFSAFMLILFIYENKHTNLFLK